MTPKEKAWDLYVTFNVSPSGLGDGSPMNKFQIKRCCLIHVGELKKHIPMYTGNINPAWEFYTEVEKELYNL